MDNLWRKKSVKDLQAEARADSGLKKALGAVDLTAIGIGAIIGAGIFVLTGQAAANYAGPAIVFSFVLAAVASALAALCYAEFASMIPMAGSAYTYSYATLGEFVAWFIGWDLLVEYSIGAAAVAVGWSGYAVSFLNQMGIHFPPQLAAFAVVCSAVLVLRYRETNLPRPFKTPWVPVVPRLGIACCLYLALSLPFEAWLRLLFWLIIGLVIYFCMG